MSQERFNPTIKESDYLVLKRRKRILQEFVNAIPGSELLVLDVGGRFQPYRNLFDGCDICYYAVDPQLDGLVDVVAFGEQLPVASDSIDLVICTQVLSYAYDPKALVDETYRVLRPGGVLLLTAPSFFPRHHDERWRFLPEGLQILLSDWIDVEILPEGHSVSGVLRTINVCLSSVGSEHLQRLFKHSLIPLLNLIGELGEMLGATGTMLTANYAVRARKSESPC